jgi:hypothetical protein
VLSDRILDDSPQEVLRQALAELERRLRAGESCQAETYLSALPTLASDPERALDLILKEFVVRQELGQRPDPNEWFRRFPQWEAQLRRQFAVLSLFAGAVSESGSTLPEEEAPALQTGQEEPPPELGRHELLEEIGHGAMGVVFRARDTVLNREVALKMIRTDGPIPAKVIQRFYREARAVAQLRHPNILPIYGMGLHEGQHCFTMPLISGGSLTQHRKRFTDDPRAAVALVEKIARAVQAAHARGIVHRDLKPGNVLLDERGEPMVADFGLAKFIDGSPDLTMQGQLVGTPAFMAPEQAAGHGWKVTAASDVWSLGVILYELLTGRRPFEGGSAEEVTEQVLTTNPPRPRTLRAELNLDLETILLKCLEKDPARRYPSAGPLAEDLACWLEGKRIQTRPARWWHGMGRKWWRPRTLALTGGGLIAVALAVLVALWSLPLADEAVVMGRELAAGKDVELVRSSGLPRWERTVAGNASLVALTGEPGAFSLDTWHHAVEELLPDPRCDDYRLSAEVRQENSQTGYGGIYVLRVEQPTPRGTEHYFVALTFADRGQDAGFARLMVRRFRDDLNLKPAGKIVQRFTPAPGTWHPLVLEVTSARVAAFWDGHLLGTMTRDDVDQVAASMMSQEPVPGLAAPALPTRGGLGLFAYESSVSFRRLRVEPLR